jgi:KDO2-lipid IV(A) lauroyltransferase
MLWRTGVAGGREIARILSKGGVIAALIDQDTTVRSAWVPFFGHPAKTPTTLVEIALRNDVALVSSFLVRTGPLAYRVSIREITDRTSIQRVLEQYHAHLEELVRQYPEQWVWIHKRWRSPNESKAMSSEEYLAWLCQGGDSERTSTSH